MPGNLNYSSSNRLAHEKILLLTTVMAGFALMSCQKEGPPEEPIIQTEQFIVSPYLDVELATPYHYARLTEIQKNAP